MDSAVTSEEKLLCVWRRHVQLHSLVSWLYTGFTDVAREYDPSSLPSARPLVLGEDPRLFELNGRPYLSMQMMDGNTAKVYSALSEEKVFRNYLTDVTTGKTVMLKRPVKANEQVIVDSFVPDGKNWVPFVKDGELFFIYSMLPLKILKCNPSDGECTWVPTKSNSPPAKVGPLRGGGAARVFGGRYVVGFGHATISHMHHSPFLYCLDLETDEMDFSFMPESSAVTPITGYFYMDPTSFWIQDGRVLVLCTVRAAADYIDFEQDHHQSIIYEASSSILKRVLSIEKDVPDL